MEEELLKAADTAIEEMEDLLKASEESDEFEDLEKSDDEEDEDGDQFVDAVPVLKSIVQSSRKDQRLIKSLEIEVSILNSKLDGLVDMVKSFGKLSIEQAKMIKSMSSAPLSSQIKGQAVPAALYNDNGKEINAKQVSALLLKGFKDKELDRDAIVRFEQQGRLTSAAEAYLAKTMAG